MGAQDLAADAADVALTIIGLAFPEAAPFVPLIKGLLPAWFAAKPYVDKAIVDGRSAFEAATQADPSIGAKIKQIVGTDTSAVSVENITRQIFKIPKMTPDEESRWMDGATPAGFGDSHYGGG